MSTQLFHPPLAKPLELGFPPATPVDAMKPEEQVAYWRFQAKKERRRFRAALGRLRREIDDLSPH